VVRATVSHVRAAKHNDSFCFLHAYFLLLFLIVTCLYGVGIGKSVFCAKRAERKTNKVEQLYERLLIRRLVIVRV
jgi:hypothetical protein